MRYKLNLKPTVSVDKLGTGMYPVIIYQLLRQYSNVNNKLSIEDIMDTLSVFWQGDKQIESSRKNIQKTIKRNLSALMLLDSNISAELKDGTSFFAETGESPMKIHKIWYEQELKPTDLQLLTDAVIYSRHLSNKERKSILNRLLTAVGGSNATTTPWYQTVLKDSEDISVPVSIDLYKNLEFINEAIEDKHCISFNYCLTNHLGEKQKVRSFSGVSPYKIIHDNGIYYLVASRASESPSLYCDGTVDQKDIIVMEIHKLDKLRSDYKSDYLQIKYTYGKEMKVQDFLSPKYHAVRSQHIMFFFGNNASRPTLSVDAMGLDILIDKYGKRISVNKMYLLDEQDDWLDSQQRQMYEVTLKGIIHYDWYELISLCLKHPHEIKIKEPPALIDGVITSLERLNEY